MELFQQSESDGTLNFMRFLMHTSEEFDDSFLLTSLQSALQADGYSTITKASHHFLRRLSDEEEEFPEDKTDLALYISLTMLCIISAGLASGLTQGLLSLDFTEMSIKSRSGTPQEKIYADKVLPIIKQHHLLLVTLMLWNACATEALPIFLNALVPEYLAIIISVTMVLFVGEIIPASLLTGPNQLELAAFLLPFVKFVICIFYPIAWPLSKLLDYLIGHSTSVTVYNKTEITTMMTLQHEEGVRQSVAGGHHGLSMVQLVHKEEVQIIGGALKYRETAVSSVMTPVQSVYMLSADEVLSPQTLYEIFKSGYSRIPVYDKNKNDIIGLVLAKDLIFVDAKEKTPIRTFIELFGRKPSVVWHDNNLGETLSMFRQARSHMAIVRDVVTEGEDDPVYAVVGIITLEDIIEEILQVEISDETDRHSGLSADLHHRASQFREMEFDELNKLMAGDTVVSSVTGEALNIHDIASVTSHQGGTQHGTFGDAPMKKYSAPGTESHVLSTVPLVSSAATAGIAYTYDAAQGPEERHLPVKSGGGSIASKRSAALITPGKSPSTEKLLPEHNAETHNPILLSDSSNTSKPSGDVNNAGVDFPDHNYVAFKN